MKGREERSFEYRHHKSVGGGCLKFRSHKYRVVKFSFFVGFPSVSLFLFQNNFYQKISTQSSLTNAPHFQLSNGIERIFHEIAFLCMSS